MSKKLSRNQKRTKRHGRIRNRIHGTAERPRLCVFRSLRHMYAQLIDDQEGKTLLAVSTLKLNEKKSQNGSNVEAAKMVGQLIAELAHEKGIQTVVFDRSGYLYHGRVKALAESARGSGLAF